jgi:hypothetical protein
VAIQQHIVAAWSGAAIPGETVEVVRLMVTRLASAGVVVNGRKLKEGHAGPTARDDPLLQPKRYYLVESAGICMVLSIGIAVSAGAGAGAAAGAVVGAVAAAGVVSGAGAVSGGDFLQPLSMQAATNAETASARVMRSSYARVGCSALQQTRASGKSQSDGRKLNPSKSATHC